MARRVSPVSSILLDTARFLLALCVAAGHFSQRTFQTGWPDFTDGAVAAVGGFFLLSGFTIRMLTPSDESFEPSSYFVERLSRLWSVMLPAVAVTVVFDGISRIADAPLYAEHWAVNTSHPALRVAANILFVNELWGRDIKLFSNTLFWSLGYEAGFYLLYGLWRSRQGTSRYVLTILGCLFLGPNIVFMLFIWLVGAVLHDALTMLDASNRRIRRSFAFGSAVTIFVVIVAAALFGKDVFAKTSDVTGRFAFAVFEPIDHLVSPLLMGMRVTAARIDGRLIAGSIAFLLLFAPGLVVAQTVDRIVAVPNTAVRVFRKIGDFTFPLYLLHFPTFVLLRSLHVYDLTSPLQKVATFFAVCAVIFWVTRYGNVFKLRLRRTLASLVARSSARLAPRAKQLL